MKARIENNIVRVYGRMPEWFLISGIPHNLRVLSDEILEGLGFFDIVKPIITEYQELLPLIPSDLVGNKFIQRVRDFTQQEITDYIERQEKQTVKQLLDKFESDGNEFYIEVRDLVKLNLLRDIINEAQYKLIRVSLEPALRPLKLGDWDIAQDSINEISRPNGILGQLYDIVKNKIDDYLQ